MNPVSRLYHSESQFWCWSCCVFNRKLLKWDFIGVLDDYYSWLIRNHANWYGKLQGCGLAYLMMNSLSEILNMMHWRALNYLSAVNIRCTGNLRSYTYFEVKSMNKHQSTPFRWTTESGQYVITHALINCGLQIWQSDGAIISVMVILNGCFLIWDTGLQIPRKPPLLIPFHGSAGGLENYRHIYWVVLWHTQHDIFLNPNRQGSSLREIQYLCQNMKHGLFFITMAQHLLANDQSSGTPESPGLILLLPSLHNCQSHSAIKTVYMILSSCIRTWNFGSRICGKAAACAGLS